MSLRPPTVAAVAAAATSLVFAASASAALSGHSHGYTLRFAHGTTTLDLPAPAKRLVPYQVSCGPRGREESVIALAAMSSGQRRLAGPGEPPSRARRCIIKKRGHKVATVHLHH